MTEDQITNHKGASSEPAPETRKRPGRQVKAMIVGGVALIVIGIALAVYMAVFEDEPFLIALGPAFIGVMIIIAALFGKKL